MSYSMSSALQNAIYDTLSTDPTLVGLVGSDIYDATPTGNPPETYVSIGDERVRDASDQSNNGAVHRLDIFVRTKVPGFSIAKQIGGAVSDALNDAQLTLSRGRLVYLRFERAETRRVGANATRQIMLRFRARVDDQ